MVADYKELKDKVSVLVSNLESISSEASKLQETNESLNEIAGMMVSISKALQEVIRESEDVYKYVNEVSVKKTLDDFNASAEAFVSKADSLLSEIEEHLNTSKELLFERITVLETEINKKFMVMGGLSIAGAVVAIVIALIK